MTTSPCNRQKFQMIQDTLVPSTDDQYDEVLTRLQEEESKVTSDLQKNRLLLPNIVKKGTINLQIDQRIKKSLKCEKDPHNFSFYLHQRRASNQSIESAISQCAQFATYSKSKYIDLKDLHTSNELFHKIATMYVCSFSSIFTHLCVIDIQLSVINTLITFRDQISKLLRY